MNRQETERHTPLDLPPKALGNALFEQLPAAELTRIVPLLEPCPLARKSVIYQAGEKVEWLYFPCSGTICEAVSLSDGGSLELLTIGREGGVGFPSLFGENYTHHEVSVQIGGAAWRAPLKEFQNVLSTLNDLPERIMGYISCRNVEIAQTALCAAHHSVRQRCARKLLRVDDQANHEEFPITHEEFARALGVRRESVTMTLGSFQQAGLLRASRGVIQLIARPSLENEACECYGTVKSRIDVLISAHP